MENIDRKYVTIALVLLVLGMLLGLRIGMTNDMTYITVHTSIMLVGFVLLAIYGMLYRLWPKLKDSGLAAAQFRSALLGSLIIPIGAGLIVRDMGVAVAAIGSVLAIVGAGLMLWMFWTRAGAGAPDQSRALR